jgi:flagellar hook-associated protein 2
VTGSVTLTGLADAINGTDDIGVTATVVASGANAYKLVLTGKSTGAANAFTITNSLSGGSGVGFTTNAVAASDASLLVNNVPITSSTNTVDSAIPGVTLTLTKKAPTTSVAITVAEDHSALEDKISDFVSAYNGVASFVDIQTSAAAGGATDNLGHNTLLRTLKSALASVVSSSYNTGSSLSTLSEAGIEFERTGRMKFNAAKFKDAVSGGFTEITKLFAGSGSSQGAFGALTDAIDQYTKAGGLIANAQTTLTSQVSRMTDQLALMQDRLARRRIQLQQEFTAADQLMSQLKTQSGSLSSFSSSLTSS